jgi:hypothetical protein
VRAFVVNRLRSWAQITQIVAQIHKEDVNFRQRQFSFSLFLFLLNQSLESLLDSSSSSIDIKIQQLGNSIKSSPSPPTSSILLTRNKKCKTPTHDYHFGSVPTAALVPQSQRCRRRNSSSNSSTTRRPGLFCLILILFKVILLALFDKPSDYHLSRVNDCPGSRLPTSKSSKMWIFIIVFFSIRKLC